MLDNGFLTRSDLVAVNSRSRNKVVCLGASTASSIIMFRCIEAMYGTSPEFAEMSISNYCTYYSSMVSAGICCALLVSPQWKNCPLNHMHNVTLAVIICLEQKDKSRGPNQRDGDCSVGPGPTFPYSCNFSRPFGADSLRLQTL